MKLGQKYDLSGVDVSAIISYAKLYPDARVPVPLQKYISTYSKFDQSIDDSNFTDIEDAALRVSDAYKLRVENLLYRQMDQVDQKLSENWKLSLKVIESHQIVSN